MANFYALVHVLSKNQIPVKIKKHRKLHYRKAEVKFILLH